MPPPSPRPKSPKSPKSSPLPRLALTCGDPNGIGPEVALKAALSPRRPARSIIILFGPRPVWAAAAKLVGAPLPPELDALPDPSAPLPSVSTFDPDGSRAPAIRPGKVSAPAARAAYAAILGAASAAMNRQVDAIVTAPVDKEAFQLAGIREADPSALLARLTGARRHATMCFGRRLRVVPVALSRRRRTDDLAAAFGLLAQALPLTDCPRARIGLRPLSENSVSIVVLDQDAPSPKKLPFPDTSLTWTLGLPIIHTAPGHAPSFPIAWQNTASPSPTLSALRLASRLSRSPNPWSTP